MSTDRPRLVVPAGVMPADESQVEALHSAFDVVQVDDAAEAQRLAGLPGSALLLAASRTPTSPVEGLPPEGMVSILESIGESVGVVDRDGRLTWANARLRRHDDEIRQRFIQTCRQALDMFNETDSTGKEPAERSGRRFVFDVGESHFESLVTVASVEAGAVHAVVGILWEITASRKIQSRIDAIDAAGSELLRFEPTSIAQLNMADRLKLLEQRIVHAVRELLHFDNFEIRLIDRETNQLELVIAVGIMPLRIGEVMYADRENSGISGYVAVTGESYICNDIARDPRYREGLDDAASSLTVPLRLHDRVIGVFNIESKTTHAFAENDRRYAEIFGRYIAMAMHILDLLVVERYTTNEQVAENVLSELSEPLGEITSQAAALRAGTTDPALRQGVDRIIETAGGIRRKLEACTTGPRSILGAEQELHRQEPDPAMSGRRVIVADNEAPVREAIGALLRQKGCDVTLCPGGGETIELIQAAAAGEQPFDLVISDIRMPDRNGYEVFRAVKEIRPETPVILITGFGYDPHHSIVRASQEGLHSFQFKPLRANQLLEAVATAFSGA